MIENIKFATCINCIDGRFQTAIINYIKSKYYINQVDMITFAGADKISSFDSNKVTYIKSNVEISLNAHNSGLLVLVGHEDCAGNPVTVNNHKNDIIHGINTLKSWKLPFKEYIGLFIHLDNTIEVVNGVRKLTTAL